LLYFFFFCLPSRSASKNVKKQKQTNQKESRPRPSPRAPQPGCRCQGSAPARCGAVRGVSPLHSPPRRPSSTKGKTRTPRCAGSSWHTRSCAGEGAGPGEGGSRRGGRRGAKPTRLQLGGGRPGWRREGEKCERVAVAAPVIGAAGVRDRPEPFRYFLPQRSRPEIYNCLLLIKRKLFCTYYRAHVCENWILILSVNLFPRAVMHCSYCC